MGRPQSAPDRDAGRVIRIPDSPRPGGSPPPASRRTVPAGKALSAIVVGLFVWLVLAAPSLRRAAEASPIGARRTVALAFLRPLSSVSQFLQLDHVHNAIARAIGRDPSEEPGAAAIAPVPVASPEPQRTAGRNDDAQAPLPAPTREDPLRLVVIGDSFASGVGSAMGRALNPRLVQVESRGVISTGLTRPDYFNWPANLREIVDRFRPGVVVVMLGGNDAQTMTVPGGRPIPLSEQDAWRRTYAERVRELVSTATEGGSRIVWIGLPPMRDINRDHQAHRLDDIYRDVASSIPGAAYVNSLDLFARPGGGYSAYLPDEGGKEQLVREGDGEHFTSLGYDWVADAVVAALERNWDLPAEAITR
jgi:uncharacterized protein